MSDNEFPYVLPMNFALDGDSVIMHSAQSGRMWETLKKNQNVCINWIIGEDLAWQDVKVGCSYRVKSKSVLVEGKVEFVDDFDEKTHCLNLLMSQYSDREFKFSKPAVENVGIIKVAIEKISAKEFGAKPVMPWKT
jgi:nitroimidazol reductase NimA-like FMN-containing flavoprotein (pyridoxamine 5'-phosphate oxidase superfamily)